MYFLSVPVECNDVLVRVKLEAQNTEVLGAVLNCTNLRLENVSATFATWSTKKPGRNMSGRVDVALSMNYRGTIHCQAFLDSAGWLASTSWLATASWLTCCLTTTGWLTATSWFAGWLTSASWLDTASWLTAASICLVVITEQTGFSEGT